jgi:hypothetical protein
MNREVDLKVFSIKLHPMFLDAVIAFHQSKIANLGTILDRKYEAMINF